MEKGWKSDNDNSDDDDEENKTNKLTSLTICLIELRNPILEHNKPLRPRARHRWTSQRVFAKKFRLRYVECSWLLTKCELTQKTS